jgi:hypothetical protein
MLVETLQTFGTKCEKVEKLWNSSKTLKYNNLSQENGGSEAPAPLPAWERKLR